MSGGPGWAAVAMAWSLSAGTAPLTPTAPDDPPVSHEQPLSAEHELESPSMATVEAKSWRAPAKRPSRSPVLARKAAAALALARAISGVIQSAPSIR
jgi:hypothetical protein